VKPNTIVSHLAQGNTTVLYPHIDGIRITKASDSWYFTHEHFWSVSKTTQRVGVGGFSL